MEPRRKAEVSILVEAPFETVSVILGSLKPELESGISDRSAVAVEASAKGLLVKVSAEDVTALRAAVNSYLYWIQGIMDIGKSISR